MPCFGANAPLVTAPDATEPLRVPFSQTVSGNGVIGQGAYHLPLQPTLIDPAARTLGRPETATAYAWLP